MIVVQLTEISNLKLNYIGSFVSKMRKTQRGNRSPSSGRTRIRLGRYWISCLAYSPQQIRPPRHTLKPSKNGRRSKGCSLKAAQATIDNGIIKYLQVNYSYVFFATITWHENQTSSSASSLMLDFQANNYNCVAENYACIIW